MALLYVCAYLLAPLTLDGTIPPEVTQQIHRHWR